MNVLKSNLKRYLVSSVLTFSTAFAIVLTPQLDSLSLESFQDGTLVGVIFLATRFGLKALLEAFVALRAKK